MTIVIVMGIVGLALVVGGFNRIPAAQKVLLLILSELPPPRHAQDPQAPEDSRSLLQIWEDGPPVQVVGVHVCPMCAQSPILQNGGPHCPRCGWMRPAGGPPWSPAPLGLNAKLEVTRASWAEDRPGAVLLPAPTQDISGDGSAAPGTPQAPPGPCPRTDGSAIPGGAWRARLTAALGPLEPFPLQPRGSRLATAADRIQAECAAMDAAALLICEAIAMDAAAYLGSLRRQLAGGLA